MGARRLEGQISIHKGTGLAVGAQTKVSGMDQLTGNTVTWLSGLKMTFIGTAQMDDGTIDRAVARCKQIARHVAAPFGVGCTPRGYIQPPTRLTAIGMLDIKNGFGRCGESDVGLRREPHTDELADL